MAPTLVVDDDGLALAAGAAGGTRLRTALLGVDRGVLDEGLSADSAVRRARFHPAPDVVNAEPGVDESALTELESARASSPPLGRAAPLLRRRQRRQQEWRGSGPAP